MKNMLRRTVVIFTAAFFCLTAQGMHKSEEGSKKEPAWKDYNLFRVVQRVREIVEEERWESKKRGLPIDSFEMSGRYKEWNHPLYGFGTATKGLCFKGVRELWTPWGAVPLVGNVDDKTRLSKGYVAFQLSVLKRMKTKFIAVHSGMLDFFPNFKKHMRDLAFYAARRERVNLKDLCRENNSLGDIWRPIAEEQLKEMEGEDIFVYSNHCFFESYYGISEVEGYKLPDPDVYALLECSNEEVEEVLGSWQKMEKRFK